MERKSRGFPVKISYRILIIKGETMTQSQYLIKRKLNILELGATLCSISEACRKLGVSRQHYYDIKSALEEEGLEGLRGGPRNSDKVLSYDL